jgi:hypothetical protein
MFGGKEAQPLEGMISHTAGEAIDVWESREALTISSTGRHARDGGGLHVDGRRHDADHHIELPKVLVN